MLSLEHEITIYHLALSTNSSFLFSMTSEMLAAQHFMPGRPRRVRVDIKNNCNYLDKK